MSTTISNEPRGPVAWVLTRDDLMNMIEVMRSSIAVVMDHETTGLDEHAVTGGLSNGGVAARVSMTSLTLPQRDAEGNWDGEEPPTFILPLSHPRSPFLGEWAKVLRLVARVMKKYKLPYVNAHPKFDARWTLATTGIDIAPLIEWDVLSAAHLIDETKSTALKEVVPRVFGVERWDDHDLSYPGASEEVDFWELGEYACIARGQLVTTHLGNVPIEKVTTDHLLWDGVEWVKHNGVISKGTQPVLTLENGLTGTPDHLVLTQEGDYACLHSIASGARRAATPTCEVARGGLLDPDRKNLDREASQDCGGEMLLMRKGMGQAHERTPATESRVPVPVGRQVQPGPSGKGSQGPVPRNDATLHPEHENIKESRGQRNKVSLQGLGALHSMGVSKSPSPNLSGGDVRPDRRERTLRTGKPAVSGLHRASNEYQTKRTCGVHGADGCPRSPVAPGENGSTRVPAVEGRPDTETPARENGGRSDNGTVQSSEVFDILNAGPRHRFEVSGTIVSNCRDTYWVFRLWFWQLGKLFLDPSQPFYEPIGEEEVADARLGLVAKYVSMPTARCLGMLEQTGIRLDIPYTRNLLAERSETAEERLDWLAERYSLDRGKASTATASLWFKQLTERAIEDGELHLMSMTKSGNPQWTKHILAKQARRGSETAQAILDQRDSEKQAQFMRSWLEKVTPDGRVHSTYRAGHVATGRLCISPDSLIEMPRDMTKYPDGVPLRDVKVGDWVYSFDHHMELTLRQVEWVGATKVDRTVIVTFENSAGEQRTLQSTPDHLVRLYNGDWRHAEYLLRNVPEDGAGPRVLSMVRRGWKEPTGNDRYLTFFPHSNSRHAPPSVVPGARYGSTSGGRNTEHRWVMEKVLGRKLSTKWDVNHRDGNKVNNHPDNLEYLPASEHRSNSHRDGTWGKEQPGTETYIGPNDFRVVSIEEGPVVEVWDMTIPEDHQFIANGIVVHNSSASPNMQQVSKKLRAAFIPSDGYYLADLDYSQLELRVAAYISRCEPMMEAYAAGKDLHALFAADQMTRRLPKGSPPVQIQDVPPEERQKAKAGNFGLLYLQTAFGFMTYAEQVYGVEMTEPEAHEVYDGFFQTWDGMHEWHQRTIREAERVGYTVSPIGRRRNLPSLYDSNEYFRLEAQRQAVNSPVQGFGSDLMQMAIASIYGQMPGMARVPRVRPVATVHDSLVAEVPVDAWEETIELCQERMTNLNPFLRKMGVEMDVPLAADATCGTRWSLTDIQDE